MPNVRKIDLPDKARDQLIYDLHKQGWSYFKIGCKLGLTASRVGDIFNEMEAANRRPPLPPEISVRTAELYEIAFGIWPCDENASAIVAKEPEWLFASGIRLKHIAELKAWLARVLV